MIDFLSREKISGHHIEFVDTTAMATSATAGLLARQLKQMQQAKDLPGISVGLLNNNVFQWEVMLMINDDNKYYGGMFQHTSTSSHLCSPATHYDPLKD